MIQFLIFLPLIYVSFVAQDGECAVIKFYDPHNDIVFKVDSRTLAQSQNVTPTCVPLPEETYLNLGSIQTNGACVSLFGDTGCSSGSHLGTLPPNDHFIEGVRSDLMYRSFHLCEDDDKPEKESRIKIYQFAHFENEPLVELEHLCKCTDLPDPPARAVGSIDAGQNCILVFKGAGCSGSSYRLEDNTTAAAQDLKLSPLGTNLRSVRLCDRTQLPHSCTVLDLTVVKIEVRSPLLSYLERADGDGTPERVSIAPTTIFINKGNTSVKKQYAGSATISESIYVSMSDFLGRNIKVYVHDALQVLIERTTEEELPLFHRNRVGHVFSAAFDALSVNSTPGHLHQEDREVGVDEEVEIGPCAVRTVQADMSVVQDHPVSFVIYAKTAGLNKMTLKEASDLFPAFEFESVSEFPPYRDYTLVKYSGVLKASFGYAPPVSGNESQLEGCSSTSTRGGTEESDAKISGDDNELSIYYTYGGATLMIILALVTLVGIALAIFLMVLSLKMQLRQQQQRILAGDPAPNPVYSIKLPQSAPDASDKSNVLDYQL